MQREEIETNELPEQYVLNDYSDIVCSTIDIVNICFVGEPQQPNNDWVLIDAGLPKSGPRILRELEERFGENTKPKAILLTHGHFDHVGGLQHLLEVWDVPVFAHEREIPYLTGKKDYLPPDPTVGGGLMALLSPFYPSKAIDISSHVQALPEDGSIPYMEDWSWIHTPGHTPGHVSFFRDKDRSLIAGDAFTTVKQESSISVLFQDKEIHGPPAYFTPDWGAAWDSVKRLEALRPAYAITGHGVPMKGEELSEQLAILAEHFDEIAIPKEGKYVH